MNKDGLSLKIVTGILVTVLFAVALYVRVYFPFDKVFVDNWINFTSVDSYYHMRIVDSLVANFPNLNKIDPYFNYGVAQPLLGVYFFNRLLAGIIWLIGLGAPSQHTINVVAVYFPAVLGALTVIPVYFIGKKIFCRWVGLIAACLVGILPGEFLGRSILGFTDYHVAEVLFTTTSIMFLIFAIKSARDSNLTLKQLQSWKVISRPVIYSLLGGLFLGIYFITWAGALLFVFIITLFFIIQFIIDHLRDKPTAYLGLVAGVTFLIPLIINIPSNLGSFYRIPLFIALLVPVALATVSGLMRSWQLRPIYFPLAVLVLGIVGMGVFYALSPEMFKTMLAQLGIFAPAGSATQVTTLEMRPFFAPIIEGGGFTMTPAWLNFNTSLILGLFGFLILTGISAFKRQLDPDKILLIIWSLVIFLVTVPQRRFCYYLTINMALLTGYITVLGYFIVLFVVDYLKQKDTTKWRQQVSKYAGIEEPANEAGREPIKKAEQREKHPESRLIFYPIVLTLAVILIIWFTVKDEGMILLIGAILSVIIALLLTVIIHKSRYIVTILTRALALIVIFFLVLYPIVGPAKLFYPEEMSDPSEPWYMSTTMRTASAASFAPSNGWLSALDWLKVNTSEPFGEPEAYYRHFELPPIGDNFTYPESAYSVMAWWDYGYWITRIAHRIPYTNPSQAPIPIRNTAQFLLSQNEDEAREKIEESNSAYIVIDYGIATAKFWATFEWAGRDSNEFYGIYYLPMGDRLWPVRFYYPEYYRSLISRLYNFGGKAVTPDRTLVISYLDQMTAEGKTVRMLTDIKPFADYHEAVDFVSSQEQGEFRIVGENPFISAVPLETLQDYQVVFSSQEAVKHDGVVINVDAEPGKVEIAPESMLVPEVKVFEYIRR